jgi:hypothetical protein
MKEPTHPRSAKSTENIPRPDRSGYQPNFHKTPENECLDLGWADGQLRDGRPFRMEVWAMDGMTGLTYFFSRQGLEDLTNAACTDMFEKEGLVRFLIPGRRGVEVTAWTDYGGNPLWSVSVLVGDEDGLVSEASTPFRGYTSTPPSNTP